MVVCKLSTSYSVNLRKFVNDLDFVAIFNYIDYIFLLSCLMFAIFYGIMKVFTKHKFSLALEKQKLI